MNCTLQHHTILDYCWYQAPIRMTLNDLECPIHLEVRLMDDTLDERLLRVSNSTIRIGVARGAAGEWAGGPSPLHVGS